MTAVQQKMADYILLKLCACPTPAEVEALERIATEPLQEKIKELEKQLKDK